MVKSQGDALLVAARILVVLIVTILVISMVAIGIGIGVLLSIGQDKVFELIAKAGAPDEAFWVVIGGFALGMVAIGLAASFFRVLHEIIVSVDQGDPFHQANARRLRKMGWLGVAGQLALIPMGAISAWIAPYLRRLGERVDLDLGLDPGALLLILVLFILARVFERGAAMQSDLEGTV